MKESAPARPDVIVVGGGPAGASAARELAAGGARVQLLDRARFPRNKPCGGAVSIRALDEIPVARTGALANHDAHVCRASISRHQVGDGITLTSPHAGGADDPPVRVRRAVAVAGTGRGRRGRPGRRHHARARDGSVRRAAESRRPHVRSAASSLRPTASTASLGGGCGLNPGWSPDGGRHRHDGGDAARRSCGASIQDCCGSRTAMAEPKATRTCFPKRRTSMWASATCSTTTGRSVSPHPWDLQRTFTSELTRRGVLNGTLEPHALHAVHDPRGRAVARDRDDARHARGRRRRLRQRHHGGGHLLRDGVGRRSPDERRWRAAPPATSGLAPRDRRRAARCRARAALPADDARAC